MMDNVMSRRDLLELYTKMLRKAEEDYNSFEDSESRRKFMNSISSVGQVFDTLRFRDRQERIEERIAKLEEMLKDERKG